MVGLEDIERNFRKFRSEFWEDVVDTNLSKSEVDTEKLKTKMMESEYFETVRKFAEERGWRVETEDITLSLQREDKAIELSLVDVDENTFFIQPWSRVMGRLEDIENR
jgi:hypothetical protein